MKGLFGLILANGFVLASAGSQFQRVIDALEGALADAKESQKTNDDEFTKTECECNKLVKEANTKIPLLKEDIKEGLARQEALRNENEALSIEATELDENVAQMTQELADKQAKRNRDNVKYVADKDDMETGVDQMDRALQLLVSGNQNFMQVKSQLSSAVVKSVNKELSLLQASAKTGTSGQIIGILRNMKETFETDLATMEAEETEAARMFSEYKSRTDKAIAAESKLSAEKKQQIADNAKELKTVQDNLKANKTSLQTMETQLADQTALLEEHTNFHKKLTAESVALQKAISNAVELLTSNAALDTLAHGENMVQGAQSFVQLADSPKRSSLIALNRKAANDYSWGAIYGAIDDMSSSLQDSLTEADEKFVLCEQQMKMHHAAEKDFKQRKQNRESEKVTAERIIKEANDNISLQNDEIASSTEEIKEKTTDIRALQAATAKESKEADDAHALFLQAIKFLREFNQGKRATGEFEHAEAMENLEAKSHADAKYDVGKVNAGTAAVVKVIEDVDKQMMDELSDLVKNNQGEIDQNQSDIKDAKGRISDSKDSIAKSQKEKASSELDLMTAEKFLRAAVEGIASESAWWAAAGNELESPGQECIRFLGREDLGGSKKREGDYGSTSKNVETGGGVYHSQTKSDSDEVAALAELKKTIEGIEGQYLVSQPAGSAPP